MIGIIIITIIALLFSIILVYLESFLDNEETVIAKLLPGYNCGACGYKGCQDLAFHILKDPLLYKRCRVLKGDNLIKMKEYIKSKYNVDID